jgi:DNA-binding MarR family transcriptional regulator
MPQFRPKLPSHAERPADPPVAEPAGALESGWLPVRPGIQPGPSGPGSGSGDDPGRGPAGTPATLAVAEQAKPSTRPGGTTLRRLRGSQRPFLHMPTLTVPSRAAVELAARELLAGPVEAARHRLSNPRELSDRIAMGRAIWRDLVIGFAAQLGELNLGFTQLAALYALADSGTMTVADLADALGRSQSAASRLVNGLVERQLIERTRDTEDHRVRTLTLTGRGQALLGIVDRARAQEFLSIVRPLPTAERALVAMGVAALSTHAISRRGHLIKQRPVR